jgi:hypothetical protein
MHKAGSGREIMTRKSIPERIEVLDLETCQYVLIMISKDVPFMLALQSAEKAQKKAKALGVPGQGVLPV